MWGLGEPGAAPGRSAGRRAARGAGQRGAAAWAGDHHEQRLAHRRRRADPRGGMGWLARQYGLACDNVVSYQVVTVDGRLVRASRTEHPDLYWASATTRFSSGW